MPRTLALGEIAREAPETTYEQLRRHDYRSNEASFEEDNFRFTPSGNSNNDEYFPRLLTRELCRHHVILQSGMRQMSSHKTPGAYEPEILKVMGEAFDRAWEEFRAGPKYDELSRFLIARAIIQAVEAGAVEATILVDTATRALRAALGEDREALFTVDVRRVGTKGPLAIIRPRSASPCSMYAA
jgi:hypothetical protein